ncbi:MAG TPA: hypothetical protein DEF34_03625 [Desulfotomaculum sp.]|nr:MAG: hypothetical protein JL56_11670 [Desulfotomaculum sp. BICA1-6]HBX22718.1 hypothetical protein [Desulfotomaculum sp.]
MRAAHKTGLIFIMCVIDCLLSWWGVQAGYLLEMNIILAPLLNQSLILFFLIKNGYTLALLMVLLYLEKSRPLLVNTGLNFIAFIYIVITALHARFIYLAYMT